MKKLIPILFLFVGFSSFMSINYKSSIAVTKPLKDTMMTDRQKYITDIKTKLGDKINLPADSVFKNVKTLKGKSAEQLLSIMDNWGHSLGVTCKFCHDLNDFASEKPRHFLQTREMVDMTTRINKEVLASLKTFRQPVVMGCMGCHNEMKEPREN